MQLINDSLGLSKPIWRKRTLDFGERSKFSAGPRGPVAGCDVQLFNEINSVQHVFAGGGAAKVRERGKTLSLPPVRVPSNDRGCPSPLAMLRDERFN